jgi:hypothetical protein
VVFLNFNLKPKDLKKISDFLKNMHIKYRVYTNSDFAIQLLENCRYLIRQYLDLHFDTGQIVPIETSVDEYNKASSGIATPLDNIFLYREQEVQEIIDALGKYDFIIVTGSPGIGKTKLVLESLKKYLQLNTSFASYCISYKSMVVFNDLEQYINKNDSSIIFVDDANRIDAISQILGFYRTIRNGKLKIVCTVRDYALEEIKILFGDYSFYEINIKKLTDKQIIDIIKAEPFHILNQEYHDKIANIADGNPRLAIMASRLAIAKQDIYALSNASALFDSYFSSYIRDKKEFDDPFNIKCLALIAFFIAIPYCDKKTTTRILQKFEIDYPRFLDFVDTFEKLEIVEKKYDYVKISEQNLAFFFFFKAFIKDRTLSFYTLLENFFDSKISRFKECVTSSNNMFGFDIVSEGIAYELKKYFQKIEANFDEAYQFLSVFWIYINREAFDCIYKYIYTFPVQSPTYFDYSDDNQNIFSTDKALDLLHSIMHYPHFIKEALNLAFEYTRRKPEKINYLVNAIKSSLVFNKDDAKSGFIRQEELFNIITKDDQLYCSVFLNIVNLFLEDEFHVSKDGKNFMITIYNYRLPSVDAVKNIRKKIWDSIYHVFNILPDACFKILKTYNSEGNRRNIDIAIFDVQYILSLINDFLDTDSLLHCIYAHHQIKNWRRQGIDMPEFAELKIQFNNKYYNLYANMKIDHLHDDFEKITYDKYEILKRDILKKHFTFYNTDEVKEFFENYFYVSEIIDKDYILNSSLDIIIIENASLDFYLGCSIIIEIMKKNNEISFLPNELFITHLKDADRAKYLWKIIQTYEFQSKPIWKLAFFYYLGEHLINDEYLFALTETFKTLNGSVSLHFNFLKKYCKFDSNLFSSLLFLIVDLNSDGNKIFIFHDDFLSVIDLFNDIKVIKKYYFQILAVDKNYDYNGELLKKLIKMDMDFLYQYVRRYYLQSVTYSFFNIEKMGFVWEVDRVEDVFGKIFDELAENTKYNSFSEESINNFFCTDNIMLKEKAKSFLFNYSKDNINNTVKINLVVDIIIHSMREYFEEYLIFVLPLNTNIEFFSSIYWNGRTTFGMGSDDIVIEEIKASDWRNILSIIEKSDVGIDLIPIKRYVNDIIESYARQAYERRREKFLYNY